MMCLNVKENMFLMSPLSDRFYKILWGKHGMSDGSLPNGIIAGGTDNGSVYLYDASKLLSNEEALITKTEQVNS